MKHKIKQHDSKTQELKAQHEQELQDVNDKHAIEVARLQATVLSGTILSGTVLSEPCPQTPPSSAAQSSEAPDHVACHVGVYPVVAPSSSLNVQAKKKPRIRAS